MTTQTLGIIHHFIGRFIALKGHSPTAEYLARWFEKPVADMRAAHILPLANVP